MEVYRLAVTAFADLGGKGGLYASGRWHHRGQPIVYTASSRALSVLERLVHESPVTMPELTLMVIHLPDDISLTHYSPAQLPDGWDLLPDADMSKDIGTEWLVGHETALLRVPSAIVDSEFNILINPFHPDAARIKVIETREFRYDERLQRMIR